MTDPDDTMNLREIPADDTVDTSGFDSAEPEPARTEPDPDTDEDASRRGSGHAARGRSKPPAAEPERPRGRVVLAGLLVLAVVGALFVPQVRLILRQSFTHLPQTYTALAFTADPTIQGTVLSVPVTVQGTNTGISTYQVRVWTVNGAGKVDDSTSAKVPTVKGVSAAVVKLPIAADAAVVWVSLNGTDHTIYYKIS